MLRKAADPIRVGGVSSVTVDWSSVGPADVDDDPTVREARRSSAPPSITPSRAEHIRLEAARALDVVGHDEVRQRDSLLGRWDSGIGPCSGLLRLRARHSPAGRSGGELVERLLPAREVAGREGCGSLDGRRRADRGIPSGNRNANRRTPGGVVARDDFRVALGVVEVRGVHHEAGSVDEHPRPVEIFDVAGERRPTLLRSKRPQVRILLGVLAKARHSHGARGACPTGAVPLRIPSSCDTAVDAADGLG
jgi:hypothetical protein